ncbi:hypothetical protein BN1263380155 [Stenotrophomonas maltophilia]|nr:hypothetical protein BN1263380155 [Stenotrophomonas maltophilia]
MRRTAHPRMAWIQGYSRPLAGFLGTANLLASGRHYRGGPPSIFHAHPAIMVGDPSAEPACPPANPASAACGPTRRPVTACACSSP